MHTRTLHVPPGAMPDLAALIAREDIKHQITGLTEQDEIMLEIQYERADRHNLYLMMEYIDDYHESIATAVPEHDDYAEEDDPDAYDDYEACEEYEDEDQYDEDDSY